MGGPKGSLQIERPVGEAKLTGFSHFWMNIDAAGREAHDPRNSRRSVFATRYGYRCGTAEQQRQLIFDYCHAARIAVGGRASDSLRIVSFVLNPIENPRNRQCFRGLFCARLLL